MVKNPPCNAEDMSSIPDQETKISHAVEQLDLCATTKNPTQPKKSIFNKYIADDYLPQTFDK